jgi:hypothetical protein
MNVLLLLTLLFFIPFALFLAFLALSSCLGDRFRARMSSTPQHASFGRSYVAGLAGAGHAGWEQIEMEDVLADHSAHHDH